MTHKTIQTDLSPAPIGPYSQARKFNGFVFVSGQIALHPKTGAMVQDNVATETKQVMENLLNVLKAENLSSEHILKTTIFLTNMEDFMVVNEVYAKYFEEKFPARETVQVSALPKNARVEISCIAAN
jgi:2-iminobutanoate/2-iminopropanoate deaminase